MKKFLCIMLCFALLLSVSACGKAETLETPAPTTAPTTAPTMAPIVVGDGEKLPFGDEVEWEISHSEDPEEAFIIAMESMKSGSLAQVEDSFDYKDAGQFKNYSSTYGFNRVIFSQLEYKINSIKEVDETTCIANVDFTNIDVFSVIQAGTEAWLLAMEDYANNGEQIDSAQMTELLFGYFVGEIENFTADKITTETDIMMVYDSELETWKLALTDTSIIAIVGSEDALTKYLI